MQPESIAGRYRVVRAVGRGGMGTVWLCTDEVLHRQVALKQVGSLPGESPDDTARAMREARLAAALNHKNAVSIYDVVEHGGSTWLVMEYFPSQTLSQLLATEGRLPPERVAHIGAQVAAALSSAHARGIVHRDIKPGNILVGEDDLAMISDFGIARGHQDLQLTQTGMVTGTPAFFSPELARGEEPTFASDVWALGITLYTATEGGPPYEAQSNPLAILSAIAHEPLPAPTYAGPLTGVLAGMLDPDANGRWTMGEALTALRDVEQRGGASFAAGDVGTVAAGTSAAYVHPDHTAMIKEPVEPAYEKSVMLPALSSEGSYVGVDGAQPPPPRERSLAGRLAMAALALLVLLGAGALLWNTLDFGADGGVDPSSTNSSDGGDSGNQKDPGKTATTADDDGGGGGKNDPSDNGPSQGSDDPTKGGEEPPPDDATTEPPDDATTEPPDDATTEPPDDATTEPPDDATTEPPDDATTEPPDDATTEPPDDATTEPPAHPPAPAPAPESFTQSYYGTVPGDLDAGWSLLSSGYQRTIGRSYYDRFWGSIDSVDVGNVTAIDDETVQYEIVYRFANGSESTEVKQLTLQPNGGSYLITSDTTVG